MKHLEKYEDFKYHSDIEEKEDAKKIFNRDKEIKESKKKKKRKEKFNPEMSKCFACMKDDRIRYKPQFGKVPGLGVVPGFG